MKEKNRKAALNNSRTSSETIRAQAAYKEANKMAKKSIRADKSAYLGMPRCREAEEAAHHGNMRVVYANTKITI